MLVVIIELKIIRFRLPDQESAFCNIYNIISSYHLNYLVVNQRVKVLIQIMTASNLHLCYLDGNNTLYCIYIHIILKEIVSSIVSSSMLSWLKYYPLLQKSSKNKTLIKTISLDIFLNLELLWWIYFWFPVFNCLLKRTTQTTNVFMKKKKKWTYWSISTSNQFSNCDGVVLSVYLNYKFHDTQENLNSELHIYEVVT